MKGVFHHRFLSWYASFSVIIGPILQPYILFGKSVALLLMFMNVLLFMSYGMVKGHNAFVKPVFRYLLFLAYCLTIPVIIGLILYKVDVGSSFRGILVFSASLLCYISFADIASLKKIFRFFVYLAIGVFFAQEICWLLLGFRFPALIPFFELSYDVGMEEFLKEQLIKDRSSSFFLEPAHLAIFVLPYLAIILVDNLKNKRILSLEAAFLSFFIICVRSGIGFVCLILLFSFVFVRSNIPHNKKLSFLIAVILIGILAFSVGGVRDFFDNYFFSRSVEIVGHATNESGLIRITRGFLVYDDFPFIGKVFGVSNGAIEDVVRHSSAASLFKDETYLNNIQKLLIGYGFIGVILFFRYVFGAIKRRNEYSLILMTLFIAICFLENMLFDSRMMLYFAIAAIPVLNNNRYDTKSLYNN